MADARPNKRRAPSSTGDRTTTTPGTPSSVATLPAAPQPHLGWTTGDFTLVSVDNVSFQIPSRILFYASEVFADANETASDTASGSNKIVHFTDPDENRALLNRFMQLAVNVQVVFKPHPTATEDRVGQCLDIVKLIRFLHKYECPQLLRQMDFCLQEELANGKTEPMVLFILASACGSLNVCKLALEAACKTYHLARRAGANAQPCWTPDPGTIPYALWSLLQPKHEWALSTAWTKVYASNHNGHEDFGLLTRDMIDADGHCEYSSSHISKIPRAFARCITDS